MTRPLKLVFSDRRRETRQPRDGRVTLAFDDPLPQRLEAELIDVSQGGFRCRHQCTGLRTGQAVRFSHPQAEGEARVMWIRIVNGGIESGFFVV